MNAYCEACHVAQAQVTLTIRGQTWTLCQHHANKTMQALDEREESYVAR